jgi:hypothetical protein
MAVSHFSSASSWPFPQVVEQSESVAGVHRAGQQPSSAAHSLISVFWHSAAQVPSFRSRSRVHDTLSLHCWGQAAMAFWAMAVSQRSPSSSAPLPQDVGSGGVIGGGSGQAIPERTSESTMNRLGHRFSCMEIAPRSVFYGPNQQGQALRFNFNGRW